MDGVVYATAVCASLISSSCVQVRSSTSGSDISSSGTSSSTSCSTSDSVAHYEDNYKKQ